MPTEISGSTGVNKIQDGTVVNADINSSAAIAGSKLVMPTGSVLQVVQNGTFAQTNFTTRSTWTSTNQNLSITPSSTSSKILVMMTVYLSPRGNAHSHIRGGVRLKRGSTVIWNNEASPEHASITGYTGETTSMIPVNALDSPSSTSSVTYSLEAYLNDGSQIYVFGSGVGGSITLMEIAG